MNLSLENKNAFVCGSTQGIGMACAMELAAAGAEVVLLARSEEKLVAVRKKLPAVFHQQHQFIVADFSDPEQVQERVRAFLSAYHKPVHILVNNTGGPPAGPITDAIPEQFMTAFQNHLINNHMLATTLLPGMVEAGYGRIINIISTSIKSPLPNLGVSNTIRAAVANWAKTLANEVGPFNITVNNVLPGATKTERLESIIQNNALKKEKEIHEIEQQMLHEIPLKRFAEAFEIANAVALLASPAAAYITGINLPVDGGRTPGL
jgi:3-oxoacyl-[acyl-carrier protein] reductase